MNDLQWRDAESGASHVDALARELGYAAIDLHYNTGLPISSNGAQLSALLDRLLAAWPQPVTELTLLTHSMGGLVARSACAHAESTNQPWRARLKNMVFLGTPHHGAPLERVGGWVDRALRSTIVTRPFAQIGELRSSGITDLRSGSIRAADSEASEASEAGSPASMPPAITLPSGVRCLAVAATLARTAERSGSLVGDGLVPLESALAQRDQPDVFSADDRFIATNTGHLDLLRSAQVGAHLAAWLRRS